VGSTVVLVNGALAAYIARGGRQLAVFLPEDEPARTIVGRALASRLAALARGEDGRTGLLISEINGMPAADHPLSPFLIESGFNPSAMGFQMRRNVAGSIGIGPDESAMTGARTGKRLGGGRIPHH
jgi:ATP-dependent Lhr-like helicase